ncbi:MAG: zinc carboxypeptidase [Calditrichaeota bacterium]|nr:zinc carboxypeptidase [Calditrichota bacterium]
MRLIFLILINALSAQVSLDYYLPNSMNYISTVSQPKDVLGFQIGDWHLRPDQIDHYFKLLAEQSDRVQLIKTGESHEQRGLYLLVISDPSNLKQIDKILTERQKLRDPNVSRSVNIEQLPAIVWLGYSVHGNEASGSNSAPLTAYFYAAANNAKTIELLKQTIILIDPHNNPDGLNRFANWANMHKSKNLVADPYSREHRENWPGGRTNHYWFDLNRDWMPLQHPESQARVREYHKWLPNIVTDHHEMGTNSTFFFEPVHQNRFNQTTPISTYEITRKIAKYHQKALDEIGSLYYSKEDYDDFYVGYGSSYPDITGGIGLLFEQASSRGHLQSSIHGDVSFAFTIRNQVKVAISTVNAAWEMRSELNEHIRNFYQESLDLASEDETVAYLLGSNDPARNSYLASILSQHQINLFNLAKNTRLNGYTYVAGRDMLVPLKQAQYRLITSLFKNHLSFADSSFYDISTWNLAHSFNMNFTKLDDEDRLNDIIGKQYNLDHGMVKSVELGKSNYAYLLKWDSYNSFRAINRLLKNDIILKVAQRRFSIDQQEFQPGTIMLPLAIQRDKSKLIEEIRQEILAKDNIITYAVNTGFVAQGIDLGSSNFAPVNQVKPLVLAGDGTSSYEIGEIWHLLDTRLELPLTMLETDYINSVDLANYTTLIMTSGRYDISNVGKEHIHNWLKQGGTLITIGSAASWLKQSNLAELDFIQAERINSETVNVRRDYERAPAFSAAAAIGGSIFMTDLDISHPIAYGFEKRDLPYLKRGSTIIKPLQNPYNTPLLIKKNSLLAGYISKSNQQLVEGSAAVSIIGVGRGRIIVFADDPNFRSFWYGTNRLFMNALIFGQIIDSPSY